MATPVKKKVEQSFAAFDAALDETVCDAYNNANLTLTLKLGFRRINPAAGAARGTYHNYGDATEQTRDIVRWTNNSWAIWKNHFLQSAQKYWHGKFWLVNNFPALEFEDKGVKYRHNVYCRFKLIGADATAGSVHHHVIDVVRLAPTENWFGSHSTLYDSLDTKATHKATDSSGNKVMQKAHVHEIGHLLGLGHAAEGTVACPTSGNTNAAACYGSSDAQMNSVMGSGMKLDTSHAYPWRMALASMTGSGTVRKPSANRTLAAIANALPTATASFTGPDFASGDWQAKMTRHYPRTDAEVISNTSITTKPTR